jgi:putative transcriptional regulator
LPSHPSSDLIKRFAAGDLPLAPSLVVESHLEVCPACAASASRLESQHGQALADLPDAPMRSDALDRALARLDDAPAPSPNLDDTPLPRALVRQGLHPRRFIGTDYWVAPVRRARRDTWRAYVLRAPAGTSIPAHRHLGQEYFQVLMGQVADGGLHRAGDFVGGVKGADHALRVSGDGPCACLIAVEHGARWRGAMRLLSPLLGV